MDYLRVINRERFLRCRRIQIKNTTEYLKKKNPNDKIYCIDPCDEIICDSCNDEINTAFVYVLELDKCSPWGYCPNCLINHFSEEIKNITICFHVEKDEFVYAQNECAKILIKIKKEIIKL